MLEAFRISYFVLAMFEKFAVDSSFATTAGSLSRQLERGAE